MPNLASVSSTLHTLLMQNNKLGQCNTTVEYNVSLPCLHKLDISFNNLTELPNGFQNSKRLRELNIRHNSIISLSDMQLWFPNLMRDKFYIGDNPIICDCGSVWIKSFVKAQLMSQFRCNKLGPHAGVLWSKVTLSNLSELCTKGNKCGCNIYIYC